MDGQEATERIEQNKAAAEFYAQLTGNSKSVDDELKDIEAFNMAIEALKSEPPKGEWIDMSDGGRIKYIWYEKYMCNKCGERGTSAWSFCPNCGAKMEK